MNGPTPEFAQFIEIFNLNKKSELEAHCKNITIQRGDFLSLILAAQAGYLPYKYANHFSRTIPEELKPTPKQQLAFHENGIGLFKTKAAQKFASKIFQLPHRQRSLKAHIFYTPCHSHWYVFYFDNRDTSRVNNHWVHGPHIHLICYLWSNLNFEDVVSKFESGDLNFSNKLHIRFSKEQNVT